MTKVGAEFLVQAWGRPMTYWREGVQLLAFKGRIVRPRPFEEQFDYSVDQLHIQIIGAATDFRAGSPLAQIQPVKFDVVKYGGEDYTVQRGYYAGADEDELVKLDVIGGTA